MLPSRAHLTTGLREVNCGIAIVSTASGFGSGMRPYYRFELANGFELAGRSSTTGTFTEILSPPVKVES